MPRTVVHPDKSHGTRLMPENFIGRVTHHNIAADAGGSESFHLLAVYFDPGSRTRPHLHNFDQFVCFIEGPGIVAIDGGEDQLVEVGGFVLLPANMPHMHGAPDANGACHITFGGRRLTDFGCPIPPQWQRYRVTSDSAS